MRPPILVPPPIFQLEMYRVRNEKYNTLRCMQITNKKRETDPVIHKHIIKWGTARKQTGPGAASGNKKHKCDNFWGEFQFPVAE